MERVQICWGGSNPQRGSDPREADSNPQRGSDPYGVVKPIRGAQTHMGGVKPSERLRPLRGGCQARKRGSHSYSGFKPREGSDLQGDTGSSDTQESSAPRRGVSLSHGKKRGSSPRGPSPFTPPPPSSLPRTHRRGRGASRGGDTGPARCSGLRSSSTAPREAPRP